MKLGKYLLYDQQISCSVSLLFYRAAAVLLESQREAEKLKKAEAEAKAAQDSTTLLEDSSGVDGGRKSPDSHIEINDNYDTTQVSSCDDVVRGQSHSN